MVRGCEGLRWIRLIGVTNLTTFRCVGDNVNTTLQRVPNLKDVCYIMKQINVISAFAGWQKIMNPNFRTLSIGESG